tara:strand:- start:383 stop:1318 length:936 start_codon:yes stop_codon:yes gene_type:complete
MIKKKMIHFIIILLIFFSSKVHSENNIFIVYKIEDKIITNIDIKNESSYLIALNNQLENLSNKKLLEIAKISIVKETVKKNELIKYFSLDQQDPYLDVVIKNFYTKLGINNEIDFQNYLSRYNLNIGDVKRKIEIETTWNQLVYETYKNRLNIDIEKLKENIKNSKKNKTQINYLLTEIVFEKNTKQSLDIKIKKIKESISEIGFKNTANIYSISDSAKFGGDIGWVNENNLSKKISTNIKEVNVGEYTNPILIGNSYIILKVESMKNQSIKIDEKKELKKMTQLENDRQLSQFSKIHYNKIKINTNISEL